jgi:hypothetical protein
LHSDVDYFACVFERLNQFIHVPSWDYFAFHLVVLHLLSADFAVDVHEYEILQNCTVTCSFHN